MNQVSKNICVIFDDNRYEQMIYNMLENNYNVHVIGGPKLISHPNLIRLNSPIELKEDYLALILPILGINKDYSVSSRYDNKTWVLSKEFWLELAKKTLLFTVVQRAEIEVQGLCILNNNESFANLNALLTAEGTIFAMMTMLERSISNLTAYTLGYGKCGKPISRLLKQLNADSCSVARRAVSRAESWRDGIRSISFHEFYNEAHQADIIVNTAPSLVLTKDLISKLKNNAIVIDIASKPGGTDFLAADELGIKAVLVPSIPGKYAPISAGIIMGDCIHEILIERGI